MFLGLQGRGDGEGQRGRRQVRPDHREGRADPAEKQEI